MTEAPGIASAASPQCGSDRRYLKIAIWVVLAFLATGVALISYRYLLKLGPVPPNIAANRHLNPWIIVHAGAASTAMLVGSIQILPRVRRLFPMVHRWMGRTYSVCCMIGGASALLLASGISSGPIAGSGFAVLGLLWMGATAKGWITARRGRYLQHRRWMIRSFALTFAAVMLRIYLPLSIGLGFDFLTSYRLIAWLCWVPNLIIAEWYIAKAQRE